MNFEKLTRVAEGEISRTLAGLPADIRSRAESVAIFLEATPDSCEVAAGIADDTLGLFDGGEADAPTPRIRLWLVNLWDYSDGSEEAFREEVRITLLHEIGHYFGWDEEDLERRGLD